MRQSINLGDRFGRLTAVQNTGHPMMPSGKPSTDVYWMCRCDCGNERKIAASSLKRGKTQSCGCLKREVAAASHITHGETDTPLYKAWTNMKNRCTSPTAQHWQDYGGRGISVCSEWLHSYEAFRDWSKSNG